MSIWSKISKVADNALDVGVNIEKGVDSAFDTASKKLGVDLGHHTGMLQMLTGKGKEKTKSSSLSSPSVSSSSRVASSSSSSLFLGWDWLNKLLGL